MLLRPPAAAPDGDARGSVVDRRAAVHGVADDPVGRVEGEQHDAVPALEVPGPEEACGDAGEHDECREVPTQDARTDRDAAAREDDDPELARHGEDEAADDVADADLGHASADRPGSEEE